MEKEKVASALCYLFIGLFWYIFDKQLQDDDFVRFHAKQAFNLFLITIGGGILLLSVMMITVVLAPIVAALLVVLDLIGIFYSVTGRKEELPLIGSWAYKYLTKE